MSNIPKQNIATISFSDMSGGINNSVAPALIAENECVDILNMEYNQSRLVTRGGLGNALRTYSGGDTYKLQQIFYDEIAGYYVIDSNSHIWYDDLVNAPVDLGALTGTVDADNRASFCKFDNKIFVASGGHLQYVSTTVAQGVATRTLTTISASPQCSGVFQRFGRLAVYHTGDDNIYFSAVGDPYETGWTEDTNDDSSSKWIEIGYKDDGDLMKVVPVVNDLIIFKSNGSVYDLSGAILQETIQLMAENVDAVNGHSVCYVSGAAYYLSRRGLMAISPDTTYANFMFTEAGKKFNNGLGTVNRPRMYNLFRKLQFMICPDSVSHADTFWCFQYDKGSVTRIIFPYSVADMVQTKNGVLVLCGKSIYRWDKANVNDAGTDITATLKTREAMANDRMVLRTVESTMASSATGETLTVEVQDPERSDHKMTGSSLFPTNGRKRVFCNFITRSFQVQITTTKPLEYRRLTVEANILPR